MESDIYRLVTISKKITPHIKLMRGVILILIFFQPRDDFFDFSSRRVATVRSPYGRYISPQFFRLRRLQLSQDQIRGLRLLCIIEI